MTTSAKLFSVLTISFRKEDFQRVFTIYGHGDHLDHVTRTLFAIFRSFHITIEFNWPCDFKDI